jgi:hypothetical protein
MYHVQRVNIWKEVKLPFFCRTSRTYPQFRNPRSFARSWLERTVLTIYGIYMDNRLNYAFRYVHGRLPQNESWQYKLGYIHGRSPCNREMPRGHLIYTQTIASRTRVDKYNLDKYSADRSNIRVVSAKFECILGQLLQVRELIRRTVSGTYTVIRFKFKKWLAAFWYVHGQSPRVRELTKRIGMYTRTGVSSKRVE